MINRIRIRMLVDALRSGEYKQTKNYLRTQHKEDVGFCCLGVACDVYKKSTGIGEWHGMDFVLRTGKSCYALPEEVMKWYGFFGSDPMLDGKQASVYNDCFDESFSQIADRFEEAYLQENE